MEFRTYLIIATCGSCYSTFVQQATSLRLARDELSGIIEAGGNIWEGNSAHLGYAPDDDMDDGYEFIVEKDVTSLSESDLEKLIHREVLIFQVMGS